MADLKISKASLMCSALVEAGLTLGSVHFEETLLEDSFDQILRISKAVPCHFFFSLQSNTVKFQLNLK